MSKHSPGPWTWKYFMETLVDARGEEVMTFMPYALKGWGSEADARLIAAAPELLAALKGSLLWATGAIDDEGHPDVKRWRALIHRIEGDSRAEIGTDAGKEGAAK